MAFSYWALQFFPKHFDECLKFAIGKRIGLKLEEVSYLVMFYNITISKLFPLVTLVSIYIFFFNSVTVKTI